MTKAVITGVAGQDGSYLAEWLIEEGYQVIGIVRRSSNPQSQLARIEHLIGKGLEIEYGDVTDYSSIDRIIHTARPDEVYNLAAQSQVWISYKIPIYTPVF